LISMALRFDRRGRLECRQVMAEHLLNVVDA
jgi:hypothetical protein